MCVNGSVRVVYVRKCICEPCLCAFVYVFVNVPTTMSHRTLSIKMVRESKVDKKLFL